jgi:hypothetical protein
LTADLRIFEKKTREREIFGDYTFSVIELSPNQIHTIFKNSLETIYLIPFQAGLVLETENFTSELEAGRCQVLGALKFNTFSICNPDYFAHQKFICIRSLSEPLDFAFDAFWLNDFGLKTKHVKIGNGLNIISSSSEEYILKSKGERTYFYVINGKFDIAGQLVNAESSRKLDFLSEIALKPLTQNSIILAIDL